jgi:hypothetical protein
VNIEGLFNQMAREIPAFNGLTWAALGDLGVNLASDVHGIHPHHPP